MITYKKGNALLAFKTGEITCLAHGCNIHKTMGAGIAKQIKEQFPRAYNSYLTFLDHMDDPIDSLGTVDFHVDTKTDITGRIIANCFTQYQYGRGHRFVDYEALYKCLELLFFYCNKYKLKLGMPKIGAGLAGGNWKIIETMINEVFTDTEVIVYEL